MEKLDDFWFDYLVNYAAGIRTLGEMNLAERTDTTLFMGSIKKTGRISLTYDVLVKAVKAIPGDKLTDSLSRVFEPDFKTDVLYRTKAQEGDSKLTTPLNLCKEALLILEEQPDMLGSEEVRIVRRLLSEQSITGAENGKLIPRPKNEIPSGSLQSAHYEDATFLAGKGM